jgi:hypothetical protein
MQAVKRKMTRQQKAALSKAIQNSRSSAVTLARPTEWDMGPRTASQDRLKVIEPVMEWDEKAQKEVPNPNGIKRARRIDLVEYYGRKGRLDQRQVAAARRLTVSWEATQRSPEAIKKVQVDVSPDHGAIAAMHVDRSSKFHAMRRMIPDDDWPILECVCIRNASVAHVGYVGRRYESGMRLMADALARLADRMGL